MRNYFTSVTSKLHPSLLTWVYEAFGLDLRSLALVRITTALLILFDLVQRSGDLVAHYTDFGVLPRTALIENSTSRWVVSFHLINGTWEVQALLFLVAAIAALALLVGYRTRLATILSWVLLVSLNARNPLVIAGDSALRAILFWAIFLPWGARWSIDKALNPAWDDTPDRCLSVATFAYFMQFLFIYWFGAALKTGKEWWLDGSAVYYALSIDQFATSFGHLLLDFPALLKPLNYLTLLIEIAGPVLLLSPVYAGPVRTLAIAGIALLHVGFALCLYIGIFTWINLILLVGLLPTWFWQRVQNSRDQLKSNITVHFDGDCGFCRTAARVLKGFIPQVNFLPAQHDSSIEADMRRYNSWVVVDPSGKRFYRYEAGLLLCAESTLLKRAVAIVRASWARRIGEKLYALIVKHRTVTCSLHGESIKPAAGLSLSADTKLFVIGALLYVFVWNLATVPATGVSMIYPFGSIGVLLGIDQKWNMFAPYPLKDDGWYVIPGRLKNGQMVDLFRDGKEVNWAKPALVSATYKNFRWQKYMMNLWRKDLAVFRPEYARYLCRNWNAHHSDQLKLEALEIYFLLELTVPNSEYSTPEKVLVHKHQCAN